VSEAFHGFPALTKATPIPHAFFTRVLPRMRSTAALLAFLWVARLLAERRAHPPLVTAEEIRANESARASFEQLAAHSIEDGLRECVELGALLAAEVEQEHGVAVAYTINTEANRRWLARGRAGETRLPGPRIRPLDLPTRPDVFRLYEENIGLLTPLVAERLLEATGRYPPEWIEAAFREAAERNVRNWRYVERILERWAEEGPGDEGAERDSFEARRRRYLGAGWDRPR